MKTIILLLSLAFLAACGGGGDEAPPATTVDACPTTQPAPNCPLPCQVDRTCL